MDTIRSLSRENRHGNPRHILRTELLRYPDNTILARTLCGYTIRAIRSGSEDMLECERCQKILQLQAEELTTA